MSEAVDIVFKLCSLLIPKPIHDVVNVPFDQLTALFGNIPVAEGTPNVRGDEDKPRDLLHCYTCKLNVITRVPLYLASAIFLAASAY